MLSRCYLASSSDAVSDGTLTLFTSVQTALQAVPTMTDGRGATRALVAACRKNSRIPSKESVVRTREIVEDIGWIVLIVLLLPLAVPILALAFVFLLGQRLYAGHRERRRLGFTW
jgi:hypothetical protein